MNGESASEGRNDQEAGEILYVHTRPPLSPLSSALSPLPLSHCQASDIESPFFSEYRLFTLNFVRFFRRPRSNYDMRYSLSLPLFLSCGQRAGRQQGGGILGLWLASRSQKSTLPIHSPWTLPSCLEGDLGRGGEPLLIFSAFPPTYVISQFWVRRRLFLLKSPSLARSPDLGALLRVRARTAFKRGTTRRGRGNEREERELPNLPNENPCPWAMIKLGSFFSSGGFVDIYI